MRIPFTYLLLILVSVFFAACSTTKEVPVVKNENFGSSSMPVDSILASIPDYSTSFFTVEGKGKAIVSEPDNSDRVTLYFSGNRQKSLITIKNSIGIEGGKLLTNGDSLLIYNKIDNYARKISVKNARLTNINNLASINLLEMMNMQVKKNEVKKVFENETSYLLQFKSGGRAYIDKKSGLIQQINRPSSSGVPYSQIRYDGYKTIEGLTLPRRITIFSADESAKVDLLVQALEVNHKLDDLVIELPDDIKMYRQ